MQISFEAEPVTCNPYTIQRGTTPLVSIPVDTDLSVMDEVEVRFTNCGKRFSKLLSAGEVEVAPDEYGCVVSTTLTSEETALLTSWTTAVAQVRFSQGDAASATRIITYRVEN